MKNIEKALNNKHKRQAEIEKELKTLSLEITALETAMRIMRGKRRGRKSAAANSVATAAKTTAKNSTTGADSTKATGNGSGIYRNYTAPKAIQHILKIRKLKATAPRITELILEGGWRTKSNKPANSIYITLARMAAKKAIKRSKKGRHTVFYAK